MNEGQLRVKRRRDSRIISPFSCGEQRRQFRPKLNDDEGEDLLESIISAKVTRPALRPKSLRSCQLVPGRRSVTLTLKPRGLPLRPPPQPRYGREGEP